MDDITFITEEALDRYYKTLSIYGYKHYDLAYKLLMLIVIEEILSGDFIGLISLDDYDVLCKAFTLLADDDCMIDLPAYNTFGGLIHETKINHPTRLTENNILRLDSNEIRVLA